MWCSRENTHMDERASGDSKARQDDEEFATDVDSGFLSTGNVQISGEVRDSGMLVAREEEEGKEDQPMNENRREAASGATTSVSTDVPMSIVDSGVVNVDLSEGLNQLTLKQRHQLGTLDSGDLVRSESTAIFELSSLKTEPRSSYQDDDLLLEQHIRNKTKKCAFNNNLWRFYCEQDDDGDTQLHIAIMQHYVEAALFLIKLAPPYLLNIFNDDWQSPLHLAVLTKQPLIVRQLILAGADPSLRNFRGNTALHLACISGDLACAKALTDPLSLIERNKLIPGQIIPALPQNLEQRNYNGEMCLHLAAANGHVHLVRLLLRLGADLEAREALAGKTALHVAIERKCWSVVNFLLQECKPCLDTETYSGLTAYQLALCIDIQFANELVRYGAKPEPLPESESDSEGNSEDEAYEEMSYLPTIVKMQNAVQINV